VDVRALHKESNMKSNIHIARYRESEHWHCSIEPEDRSWILFVPKEGDPTLMIEAECQDESGAWVHGYVAAGDIGTQHQGIVALP
jgi:hypothetical protein